jgi:hypothetical protein
MQGPDGEDHAEFTTVLSRHAIRVAAARAGKTALNKRRYCPRMRATAEAIIGIAVCVGVLGGMPRAGRPDATAPAAAEQAGPWAFTERSATGSGDPMQMATTPAREDANVWLLLVCAGTRLTASIMHTRSFHYLATPGPELLLRFDRHPEVTADVQSVNDNQLSMDEATTRLMMPLIIDSERLVVSLRDSAGERHDYTFVLQPNGRALAAILHGCWSESR